MPLSYRALWAATLAFAANFSVWTLYAVMGIQIRDDLFLSSTQLGILLAAPIFSGAVLRWPIGILAERMDCKKLYLYQMILLVPALFLLPTIGSYTGYLAIGLWLGISGVSFTIGIRYVSEWFETRMQGTAMGVFGSGNLGAAITLLILPLIIKYLGWDKIGLVYAIGMIFVIALFALLAPKPIQHTTYSPSDNQGHHWLRDWRIWRFGLYYYFVFGSFLALILWLPQYYMNAYNLSFSEAMNFTLLFAFTSSLVRALGGWFSDRYGARTINWSVFWVCLVSLFFLSYPPTTMTIHGIEGDVEIFIEINKWVFTFLLLIIGLAQGFGRASVYKTIHDHYPLQMGRVGGFVAFIGALGGCTLPVMFGLADDLIGVHSASFMLLYGVLAGCMILMHFAIKADEYQQRLKEAIENNFLTK